MQIFPRIITAQLVREGQVEDCVYRLFQHCESAFLITYKYLLICYTSQEQKIPCLVLSLESSLPKEMDGDDASSFIWFLCAFWANTHKNLGVVETEMTVQEFETIATQLASTMLLKSTEMQKS